MPLDQHGGDGRGTCRSRRSRGRSPPGTVKTAEFKNQDQQIVGQLTNGDEYQVGYPTNTEESLTKQLKEAGVRISADPQTGGQVIGAIIQIVLPVLSSAASSSGL